MKYVYMLRCGNNHYKVGIATSVVRRVKELQTSCPQKIEIVCASLVEDAATVEVGVHSYLLEHRLDGGREWFELTPEKAIEALIMINKNPDISGLADALSARDNIAQRNSDLADINSNLREITHYIKRSERQKERERDESMKIKELKPKKIASSLEEYIVKATEIFLTEGKASTSLLQRRLGIGYAKAAKIIDIMESRSMVGPGDGAHPRMVLFES